MQSAKLQVVEIGALARELVGQVREAEVTGITSRGIFLRLVSGWIVFMSFEQYRGPLTMNLGGDIESMRTLKQGEKFVIGSEVMQSSYSAVHISIRDARVWSAPNPPSTILSLPEIQIQLHAVTKLALAGYSGEVSEPAGVLAMIASFEDGGQALAPALDKVIKAGKAGDYLAALEYARDSLGLGGGLTPWGDDLNLGIILALNRWADIMATRLDLPYLYRRISQAARAGTTTLSANLIECATRGQADERLLLALDGILSGTPGPEICASALLSWGSSSGMAVLAGIALGIGVVASPH